MMSTVVKYQPSVKFLDFGNHSLSGLSFQSLNHNVLIWSQESLKKMLKPFEANLQLWPTNSIYNCVFKAV